MDPDILNTCGTLCPEPIMMLHARLRVLAPGSTLRIDSTDPSTRRDIPDFCRQLGHELLETREHDGIYSFTLKKSTGQP